jgi:adenylosuccinate synthase
LRREGHRFEDDQNVDKNIEPWEEEVGELTGRWRRVHNWEFNNLYASPN